MGLSTLSSARGTTARSNDYTQRGCKRRASLGAKKAAQAAEKPRDAGTYLVNSCLGRAEAEVEADAEGYKTP